MGRDDRHGWEIPTLPVAGEMDDGGGADRTKARSLASGRGRRSAGKRRALDRRSARGPRRSGRSRRRHGGTGHARRCPRGIAPADLVRGPRRRPAFRSGALRGGNGGAGDPGDALARGNAGSSLLDPRGCGGRGAGSQSHALRRSQPRQARLRHDPAPHARRLVGSRHARRRRQGARSAQRRLSPAQPGRGRHLERARAARLRLSERWRHPRPRAHRADGA